MDKLTLLIVDDEPNICEAIRASLVREGLSIEVASSGIEALQKVQADRVDIIISDVKMPGMDGFALFERVSAASPDTVFILITAFGTIQAAVDALRKGVYDYIPKPFTPEELRIPVRRAIEKKLLLRENQALRSQIEERYSFQNIIGNSAVMHDVFHLMRRAASSESNVLIIGESGTGKELVAKAVHSNSVRARKKFVPVNCGAIPEGLLESELFGYVKGAFTGASGVKKGLVEEADQGTLFLDEIGELPMVLQVKFLRVLQEGEFTPLGETKPKKVDIRLIAATNRDLHAAINEKRFREDLFYRLNVIPIELPPLRKRKEDIPLLVQDFIRKHKGKAPDKNIAGIAKEALQALIDYDFPGNIRELENVVEYAIAFTNSTTIQRDDLPRYIFQRRDEQKKVAAAATTLPLREAKIQFEKELIMAVLIESGGNISEAARRLNIHRQNLQQKIRLLGIESASLGE
ncbi:MAG TPA: sigma-54 dependent transcriptional regulator [Dissulfurispiraceae bacterium]|nr:sigma-54 dependent transcriptional regulator [Dissulfurispiraceae bacterium]